MKTPSAGIHRGVPMAEYLDWPAMGSGRLEWLATSPLHYHHMLEQPREQTDSMQLGEAVHMATLEHDRFERVYVPEPDLALIAPDAVKPRATKAYRETMQKLRDGGQVPLRTDEMEAVRGMAAALRVHEHSAAVLNRADEREVSLLWERDGRLCRARADALSIGNRILADVKVCRQLADFSPWVLSRMGYYRQLAWYVDGLRRLGVEIEQVFFLVVEPVAPHDVGVFVLGPDDLAIGIAEADELLAKLDECERTNCWPGRFPDLQRAALTDAVANRAFEEVA